MDVKRRQVIKRSTGVATIPVSADHRNGDWIVTDIYEGELMQNITTGLLYTRLGNDILDANGKPLTKDYRALISQTGTSAPSVIEFENTIGAIVWTRLAVGKYMGTLVGAFTINKVECYCGTPMVTDRVYNFYRKSADAVELYTYEAGVFTDAIIDNLSIKITIN